MVNIPGTLDKPSGKLLGEILKTFLHRIQNILHGKPYTIDELNAIIDQIHELTAASLVENMDIPGIETSPIIGKEYKKMYAELLEIYRNLPRIQRTLYLMAQNENAILKDIMLELSRGVKSIINESGVNRLAGVEYITNIPELLKKYELMAKLMKLFINIDKKSPTNIL